MKATPVQARSLVLQVRDEVARLIDAGHYRPGDPVGISELARRFAISATPVREALARLAAEGRLHFHDNVGYKVPEPPTAQEYLDWATARIAVESTALQAAFGPLDGRAIDQAEAINEAMRAARFDSSAASVEQYSELNRRFHAELVAVSRNPLLIDMQARLYAGGRFARVFVGRSEPATALIVAEHQRIIDALRAGEPALAARALREHIVDSLERDARLSDRAPALRRLVLADALPGRPERVNKTRQKREGDRP